jgi:hypothetical protein
VAGVAISKLAARNGEDVRPGPLGVVDAFAARPGRVERAGIVEPV